MPELPRGTVAFLFTDIEGSTGLWERFPDEMRAAYALHDAVLHAAVGCHGGVVFKIVGDGIQAAFDSIPRAVHAAADAQRALAAENWPVPEPLRVRMAVHAAEVSPDERGDYRHPGLNRLGRLLAACHGAQIVLSQSAARALDGEPLQGMSLHDLGAHRFRDLARAEHVFQVAGPGLPSEFPVLRSLDSRPNNLPVQPTQLVGRERELAAVRGLALEDGARLVTLLGPGGIGKTRLALQVAAELLDAFPDGVWFVELAVADDASLVAAAVARAVGVREDGGQPLRERLIETLRDGRQLLVLDNCEHVVEAGAKLAAELLSACPGLQVLVTSRAALRLRGERTFAVEPLELPDAGAPPPLPWFSQLGAVRLFLERAGEARDDFELTVGNAETIADICRRLEGIPLAIELAAARMAVLSVEALRDRLAQPLQLLTSGPRDLPPRQRTLRHAIAWSHELLAPSERVLFRRLAVFAGGFTLEDVTAIEELEDGPAANTLDGLTSLVEQSLVRRVETGEAESRFAMLEAIREFAREMLVASGEEAATRRRHAARFLALTQEADAHLKGPNQGRWLDALEAGHANLGAALGRALVEDPVTALRLAVSLRTYWHVRGHLSEGRGWLERSLAAAGDAPAGLRAGALHGIAAIAMGQADYALAEQRFDEALGVCRSDADRQGEADSTHGLGSVAFARGDYARAEELFERALGDRRAVGDQFGVAACLNNLGNTAHARGDYPRANTMHETSLAIKREVGDQIGIVTSLNNLGLVAQDQGDLERADRFLREALTLQREMGDRIGIALTLTNIGMVAHARGDLTQAAAALRESLPLSLELGDQHGTAYAHLGMTRVARTQGDMAAATHHGSEALRLFAQIGATAAVTLCLDELAAVHGASGRWPEAVRGYAAAAVLRTSIGLVMPALEQAELDQQWAAGRSALGDEQFASAWQAGAALTLNEAVAEALADLMTGATMGQPGRAA